MENYNAGSVWRRSRQPQSSFVWPYAAFLCKHDIQELLNKAPLGNQFAENRCLKL